MSTIPNTHGTTSESLHWDLNSLTMTLTPIYSLIAREDELGSQDELKPARTADQPTDSSAEHPGPYEPDTAPSSPFTPLEALKESVKAPEDSGLVDSSQGPQAQTGDYPLSCAQSSKSVAVVFKERVEIIYNMGGASSQK
jgi:hypothetical protein